jgi:hypothetical protein
MRRFIAVILLLASFFLGLHGKERQLLDNDSIRTVSKQGHLIFSPPYIDRGEPADIRYFLAGLEMFVFDPPPKNPSYFIRLRGVSAYPYLWIQIRKVGRIKESNIKLWMGDPGAFDKYYVFKDGKGQYEISIFGTESLDNLDYDGLATFRVNVTRNAPSFRAYIPLNREILNFAVLTKGKTVGSGECWDLVQVPLDIYSADWPRSLEYGLELNPARDEIKPGDIIQFRSVRIVTEIPGVGTRTEIIGMPDHTAVVYEVLGENRYKLLHQNINGKRYVIETENDFSGRVSGSIRYFRPIAGLLNPPR